MTDQENILRLESELKERIKELNAFYSLNDLVYEFDTVEEVCNEIVNVIIPNSMQFPDKTIVLLTINDEKYSNVAFTDILKEGQFLSCPINVFEEVVGEIVVGYLDDSPFIDYFEQKLIESIAKRVSKIAERLSSRNDLFISENRYRRIFEAAKDGILILDAKTGMILDVNPFLINLLGYSKEQFIKKYIWEIGVFKDIINNQNKFLKLQQEKYVRYENLPLETLDGRKIEVEFVSNVYSEDHHDVIQCNIRDITDHRKYEQKLRNSKNFTDNLINTANAMIVGLDTNGNVNIFNDASELITEYSKVEIIGKNWFNEIPILPKDEIESIKQIFNNILIGDEIYNTFENSIVTKHGEIKYILWQNNEILENDEVVGTISFGLDITDRKKYEATLIKEKDEAERSDKMKLEFLCNMSHDLRTPMNAIIGFSDLLRTNNLNKKEKEDYISTIITNGKFLMALIDDIIDISKIDAGGLKIENKDFELYKLMEELRLSYSKQVKDKKIDIIIDVDINKNVIINTDKYRLRQILINLIGNAIKFTKDGYVKFGYKVIDEITLEIYVEDTGPGIERQYQKIIFERFKQLTTNGDKFKGAGLGLSITKSLIELLGFKEIKLISELGSGSKFYFYVPYKIKHFNYIDDIKKGDKNKKMNFRGRNILLIEDDKDSRTIIKSFLKDTNANVIESLDGKNVLDIIKNNKINLVLLDIGLPDKTGYQILEEIREHDDRLPIIIESALAMPDEKSKAYKLGCDDFISKPFAKEDFLNKIDNLI